MGTLLTTGGSPLDRVIGPLRLLSLCFLSACAGCAPAPAGDPGPPGRQVIDQDLGGAPLAVAECPWAFTDANTCLSIADGERIVAIGMDRGGECEVRSIEDLDLGTSDVGPGIALLDDFLYFCADGALSSVKIASGLVLTSDVACRSVAAWKAEGLSLLRGTEVIGVEVQNGTVVGEETTIVADLDPGLDRHSVADGVVYATMCCSDELKRYDLQAEAWLPPLPLEGLEGPFDTFGLLNSGEVALSSASAGFWVFDAQTGEQRRSFEARRFTISYAGLVCDPYPAYQHLSTSPAP